MIVVLESPCAPQQSAVDLLFTMPAAAAKTINSWNECASESRVADWSLIQEHAGADLVVRCARRLIRMRNTYYARAAMLDSLLLGEAPYASHLLYTQVLDDDKPDERERGMSAGIALSESLLARDAVHAFYVDLGWSGGMGAAMVALNSRGEERRLSGFARTWYEQRVGALAWLGAP
jgi:hypothetical protein